ncbi:MAG: phosphate acyltransferase PlsX [Clostridiaceae bacterium]|nr:phosphate acyltransferase PlsX [Clostridiaceae bacterium]
MKIILDCMSGDLGPQPAVEGAAAAVKRHGIEVMLVGKTDALEDAIRNSGVSRDGLSIRDAQDVITMADDPVVAIRDKKQSSMVVALSAVAAGDGDAVISAGNTGALLTGATLLVRRLPGARRGALGTMFPTARGHSLLMDCGANVECTPEMLVQFAHMGSAFYAGTMGVSSPRVGLLNNGAEPKKGTPLYVEAHQLLRAAADRGQLNFIGNIEGRELPNGAADVCIADGFTGNLVLKTFEGVGLYMASQIKAMLMKNAATKLAALPLRSGLHDLKARMDYKEVGGAPILGIRKPVIKAHGSSDARAFASAISQTVRFCESGAIANMERALAALKDEA